MLVTDTTAGTPSMPGMMGEGTMTEATTPGAAMTAVKPATATLGLIGPRTAATATETEMRGEIRVEMR
jgi:hypothetical protein